MLSTPDAPRAITFTPVEPTPGPAFAWCPEGEDTTGRPDVADWHDLLEAVEDHARGVLTLSPFLEEWAVRCGLPIPAFGTAPGYRLYPSAR